MQDRKLSLESRRTSRVNKLLPVRVRARETAGPAEMLGAWTVVVNRHGARFESKRPFDGNGAVEVTVLATGRSATGKLIWANPRSNFRDNFEFAVELHEPANMWGITFPPEDWEESEGLEAPEVLQNVNRPLKIAKAKENGSESTDVVTVLEPVAKIGGPSPPAEPLGIVAGAGRSGDLSSVTSGPTFTENNLAISHSSQTGLTTVPPAHLRSDAPEGGRSAMTDRLTEVVRELIESAVRIEEDVASERLVSRVAVQLEQARQAVFSGLEAQVNTLAASHTAKLEERANEVESRSREVLEENLRRITEAGEMGMKLIREEAEASFSVIESLRKDIDQYVGSLEEQFLEKCRSQADEVLATSLETARVTLSTSVDEAGERLEQSSGTFLSEMTGQMEERSARALAEIASRLESHRAEFDKGLASSAKAAADDLAGKQQAVMQQVQSQCKAAAEHSLSEMRAGMARLLQGLMQSATSQESPQIQ